MVDDTLLERMGESAELCWHRALRREVIVTFDLPWEGNTCG